MEKNKLIIKLQLFILFISTPTCYTSETKLEQQTLKNVRNIIILFDAKNNIGNWWDPIVGDFAAALYQRTAPILISNSIWNAFVNARKQFSENLQKEHSKENILQKLIYCINEHLQKYPYQLSKIAPGQPLNKSLVARSLNLRLEKEGDTLNTLYNQIKNEYERLIASYICFFIPFDGNEWSIFENEYVHLLIPHSYESRIASQTPPDLTIIDKKLISKLEPREIKLNLKLFDMNPVSIQEKYHWPLSSTAPQQLESTKTLEDILESIFVNKDDPFYSISKNKELIPEEKELYLPSWILYLSGHGGYSQDITEIKSLMQQIKELHKKVGFFRSLACPPALKAKEIEPRKQDYCKNLQELFEKNDELASLINTKGGIISGLSVFQFQTFLQFLQNKINSYLLYYKTCYGGGVHIDIPYLTLGFPEKYNFTIVNGTLSDNLARAMPFITVRYFSSSDFEITSDNRIILKLGQYRDLSSFFYYLDQEKMQRGTKSLEEIIQYVQPIYATPAFIVENVPLIRYPRSDRFVPINLAKEIIPLNKITLSTAIMRGKVLVSNKELALLYIRYVPIPLEVAPDSDLPVIVSMIPGNVTHFIKTIEAPHNGLTQVIKKFLGLYHLTPVKRFLIETITCKNDLSVKDSELLGIQPNETIRLENVIIARNIPTSGKSIIELQFKNNIYRILIAEETEPLKERGAYTRVQAGPAIFAFTFKKRRVSPKTLQANFARVKSKIRREPLIPVKPIEQVIRHKK